MSLETAKDRFLSVPWIYDTFRPLVVGGIDHEDQARFCKIEKTDRVFDLGCGTAQLLNHIHCEKYLGVDLDAYALERASRFSAGHIRFLEGDAWDDAYRELEPTVVLMIGVVHHLPDGVFQSLIQRLRQGLSSPPRLVTFDVGFFKGAVINNLFSKLDRGKYVRNIQEYEQLFHDSRLQITSREILLTRLRYVRYIGYHLAFQR